jgi:hypothetical protein
MSSVKLSAMVAVCGLAAACWAQQAAPPVVKTLDPSATKMVPIPNKPSTYTPTITTTDGRIEFEAVEHDFGTISDDQQIEYEFKFTNKGVGPLEITNTHGSCGCTVGSLEKRVYQPGEGGSIKVSFNPAGKRDQQHTTVTVASNDATKPQTVLNIKALVRPLVMIEPQFAMLNQVPKARGGSTKLTISSRIAGLSILSATPSVAYLDAKVSGEREVEVNGETLRQWDLEVVARPEAPVGNIAGVVQVRTSDEKRVLTVSATGEVVGDVMVTPRQVQIAGIAPGQAINTQVTLKSRNGMPFRVIRVDELPSGPNSSVKTFSNMDVKQDTSTTPPSYILTLTGTASESGGQVAGQLVVRTDVKGEEEVRVPYFGYVRAQPKAPPPRVPTVWEENPSSLIPSGPR